MPKLQTHCPGCHDEIEFGPGQCALLGGADGQVQAYAFVCPRCGEPVVRRADRRTVAMLMLGGASSSGPSEPVRPPHPERPPEGPPVTADDLIDFHVRLAGDDWPEWLSSGRSAG